MEYSNDYEHYKKANTGGEIDNHVSYLIWLSDTALHFEIKYPYISEWLPYPYFNRAAKFTFDFSRDEFGFFDGTKISILFKAVAKELECSPEASDKLYDIAIEKPIEYAQMVFDGTIREYCD